MLQSSKFWTKIAVIAGTIATFSMGAAGAAEPKNLHLIAIGETYDQAKGAQKQSPLPCCAKDAIDMARWAQSQKGKLFQEVSVRQLIDTEANAADVINALNGLRHSARAGDYSIVYMSGHGGRNGADYEFCAHNRNISWRQIREALRGVPGTVIVILDACQSGAVIESELVVFAASLAHQPSVGYVDSNRNSLFTRLLLEGLNGKADMNKDGRVSLAEVDAYVSGQLELNNEHPQSTLVRPANLPSSLPLARLTANNNLTVPAAPPAPAVQLDGSTWAGQENVNGYGNLSFRFEARGQVTMFDAQSTVPGTFTRTGNQVTIHLPGVASYRGEINGDTFAGQGSCDSLGTWNFSVTRK